MSALVVIKQLLNRTKEEQQLALKKQSAKFALKNMAN